MNLSNFYQYLAERASTCPYDDVAISSYRLILVCRFSYRHHNKLPEKAVTQALNTFSYYFDDNCLKRDELVLAFLFLSHMDL